MRWGYQVFKWRQLKRTSLIDKPAGIAAELPLSGLREYV
jgi:hypothetical protein